MSRNLVRRVEIVFPVEDAALRERIANFEAPRNSGAEIRVGDHVVPNATIGVSINDLRKNLRDLNEHMDRECANIASAVTALENEISRRRSP